tara:strand:- start:918 stop:1631 length:714 start_codon:yes stop_codon:yes gene_type:complete
MKNNIKGKKLIYLFITIIISISLMVFIEINSPRTDNVYRLAPKYLTELLLNIIILYFFKIIVFDNLENYKNYKRNTKIFLYFIGSWIMGMLFCFFWYKFQSLDEFDRNVRFYDGYREYLLMRDSYEIFETYAVFSIMIIPLVISILISLKNRKKIWYKAMNIVSSFYFIFQILVVVGCYIYYGEGYVTMANNSAQDFINVFIYGHLYVIFAITFIMFFRLLSLNIYKYFKLKRSVKD